VPQWTEEERRKLAAKLSSVVRDNGLMHYGMGLRGSLCGVVRPERQETYYREEVKCPRCLRLLRQRP